MDILYVFLLVLSKIGLLFTTEKERGTYATWRAMSEYKRKRAHG